jgi:hypothetical protein
MSGDEPKRAESDLADARSALLAYEAKRTGRPVGPAGQSSASPVPAPSGTAQSGGGKEELLAAWDSLVDHEANKRPVTVARPPAWRRLVLPAVALVATLGGLYLTFARPAWLYPLTEVTPRPLTDAAAEQYAVTAAMLFAQHQLVLLVSFDETTQTLQGPRVVDHQGRGMHQRVSTTKTVGGGGVVLLLERGVSFERQRARGSPIRLALGSRRERHQHQAQQPQAKRREPHFVLDPVVGGGRALRCGPAASASSLILLLLLVV